MALSLQYEPINPTFTAAEINQLLLMLGVHRIDDNTLPEIKFRLWAMERFLGPIRSDGSPVNIGDVAEWRGAVVEGMKVTRRSDWLEQAAKAAYATVTH